ncbi:MAG: chromosomal replication initiator protein DnaA, partial [bacterium]
ESFTLAGFVVRDSTQLAIAAARATAEQPGTLYNPLYLHGGTGLGKSHLLHAFANEFWRQHPDARVSVVNAEDFANEFIEAIRAKNTKAFRDKYTALDCLVVDDIHFLMNKPNCQEAFLHAFNTAFESSKQIVVSADRKPRDLQSFPERLISRLEGGLQAELTRPAFETRLAILQAKAITLGLDIPTDSLATIANLVTTNVRALEGCLKLLKAQLTLRGTTTIAHQDLEKLVLDFLSTTDRESEVLDLNTIMEKVASHYRVPIGELVSKKRTASVAHPRQMVMYFCRLLTSMSLEEIGRAVGGRDHSTVLYACQKIQGRAQVDPTFRREVEFVRSLLTGQRNTPRDLN